MATCLDQASILLRLKDDTRCHHEALERQLDLLDPTLTTARYVVLLMRFYGFYAPIEARLARVPGLHALGLDFDARRKTPLLVQDLTHFGQHEIDQIARCADLPALDSVDHALGCLYVLEGATLGGQIIIRHLRERIGIGATLGGCFFASYGAHVGRMWKAFGACVTSASVTAGSMDLVVGSARETFAAFGRWFQIKEVGQ